MHKECIDGDRIFIIHGFFTPEECGSFVARSEQAGYDEATINTSVGVVMNKAIRDNARLILDDPSLADTLWQRLQQFLPPTIEEWRVLGLNERLRFYRYDPGQKFAPHFDGYFERDNGDRSQLTFMVYLNDEFTGGETRFYGEDRTVPRAAVRPECGMALVFAHLQLHEGAPVVRGRKYVLRTDVMYTLSTPSK
jgi:predicted 2-oxoglutarate/Fe(II)-dependent dioxygenase YbiX